MATLAQTSPQPQPQLSLVAKLAAACDAVGGVEKKGRNEFQRYNYVKAADVAKAIRHELFSRGVVIIPDETEYIEIGKIKTNSGGEMREFKLVVEFTIYDSESNEKIVVKAIGIAMDSGDKAIYKCKTGATKYFLRALGLIPDEKDDPEFDETVDEKTDSRVTAMPDKNARNKKKKIAEFQARAWDSACRDSGKTAMQVAEYLKVKFRATSVMDLTPEEFTFAIQWALGTEETVKTLQASLDSAKQLKHRPPQPAVDLMDQRVPDEFTGD